MVIGTLKDTADIRAKLLEIWKLVDEHKISSSEARLHISLARAVLETMKVEIAFAHLTQSTIPSVPIGGRVPLRIREQ
jgi:hypothetical protein